MKVKTLSALAGLGGALIMSSSAQAAFLGVELVNVTNWWSTVGPSNARAHFNANGGAASYSIYRLFAKFDGAGSAINRVNALYGNVPSPWSRTFVSGSVYNYIEGSGTANDPFVHFNLAPTSGGTGVPNPARGWETWATIGTQNTASVAGWAPGSEALLNNFVGNYSATNAALFITPDDAQGLAIALNNTSAGGMGGTGFGVLLMQITVNNNGILPAQFSGNLGVTTGSGNNNNQAYSNIPAPGALALLGLAGLVGSRRRRG